MIVRLKAATPEFKQLSKARDLLARAWKVIYRYIDRSFWTALSGFLAAALICVLSMIAFHWLSNVFDDAGIPFLGGLMTLMFWLMGIAGVMLILFGKFWVLFRG